MKKVFKIDRFFYLYITDGLFWFRFFDGYGLSGKNVNKKLVLFSERSGRVKTLRVLNWSFKILKPNNF